MDVIFNKPCLYAEKVQPLLWIFWRLYIGKRSLIRIAFMREYRIYLNEIRCCCPTNPWDFCKSISNGTKIFWNGKEGAENGRQAKMVFRAMLSKREQIELFVSVLKRFSTHTLHIYKYNEFTCYTTSTTCIIYCILAHWNSGFYNLQ